VKSRKYFILMIIFFSSLMIGKCSQKPEEKEMYFSKKTYTETPLPDYAEEKDRIPTPIIDDNPGWINMYWKCWELALTKSKKPYPGSPFVSNYIDEAFCDNIFQWDTHFMLMFWNYIYYIFPAIESHDNFYASQHSDGFICREINEFTGEDFYYDGKENNTLTNTICPPLFPWVEYEYYKISGDDSRFARIFPVLEKYGEWIDNNRINPDTKHGLYWQTGLGSGMDNTPRSGSGWICLSSQMAMFYLYLGKICEHEKINQKAEQFYLRSKTIAEKINRWMWDEADGMYYDVDDAGQLVKVKTAASFWPMLAQICSEGQAARLVENLKDPQQFWRTIPFPTLSADHPDYHSKGNYWLGSVWAPTNYMIIKGLQNYGYHEFAAQAAEKYLQGMYHVFNKTGTVWENYTPDSFEQGSIAKGDFVGWTGLGPISLLIENVLGIQLDALNNTIHWRLNRTDRHGIENLHFRDAVVTLIAEKRKNQNENVKIFAEANTKLKLKIYIGKKFMVANIKKGENNFEI